MRPLPWSPTGLDTFVNCPFQYHGKYVTKEFKEDENNKSEEQKWGIWVHKQFEDRLAVRAPLHDTLKAHEPFMQELENMPGVLNTEQKAALDKNLRPCHFFDRGVWMRQVIDVTIVNGETARMVDYKTGKPHKKFKQLMLNALYTFILYPSVQTIQCDYYWTKDMVTTGESYQRDEIDKLWGYFVGDLKQYRDAFKTDTWQMRPSGLCRGWCPRTDCQHWKPKRTY
ncbi:PD-(D/E)XK nuclease family protein [Silvimonas sp.]|uniref:PD-(D/E)XK nuclease family protein n=1 Tax=Silvimonas sp. TaxID=2650811 RepID=UPI002849EE32|nr:PD-(D/E)XK nuclease family protein [Silvimonas sp.]MDR3427790.1 PD-(D/E)XK nuclease family protein [Silvimonas sp.]